MWRRKVLAELTFLTASAIVFGWLGILIVKLVLLPQNLGGMLGVEVPGELVQEQSDVHSDAVQKLATDLHSLLEEPSSSGSDGSSSNEPKPDG